MLTFLAADIFYYLAVGKNLILHGFLTYDTVHVANGFHPLWQWLVAALYAVSVPFGAGVWLHLALLLVVSTLLLAFTLFTLAIVFRKAYGELSPLFLLLPSGAYAALAAISGNNNGTLWSFANGMESPLLLLAYALLLLFLVQRPRLSSARDALLLGLLATFVFLARLDHVLLLAPLYAGLAIAAIAGRRMRSLVLLICSAMLPALALGLYLLLNHFYAGSAFPTSAAVKSGFPEIAWGSVSSLWTNLLPIFAEDTGINADIQWRAQQIFIPMLFALICLARYFILICRKPLSPIDHALAISAVFVLLLGAYNLLYVWFWHQGTWYFPVSCLFVSLWLIHVLQARRWIQPPGLRRAGQAASAVLLIAVGIHLQRPFWTYGFNVYIAEFLDSRLPELQARYNDKDIAWVEYNDALFAYGTSVPTLNGYMLMADPEAIAWQESGNSLLLLAYERGFRYIACWPVPQADALHKGMDSDTLREALMREPRLAVHLYALPSPSPLRFELDYHAPDQTVIVRMERVHSDPSNVVAPAAVLDGEHLSPDRER